MQVNGTAPTYGPQYSTGTQPVTYVPGTTSPYNNPDQFKPSNNNGGGGFLGSLQKKQYVTRTSVVMGLAGAGIGFMVGGPIGALIGGVIGLLISVLSNIFKGGADSGNQQKPPQQMVPGQPPYYQQTNVPYSSNSEEYYRNMRQQQIQETFNR